MIPPRDNWGHYRPDPPCADVTFDPTTGTCLADRTEAAATGEPAGQNIVHGGPADRAGAVVEGFTNHDGDANRRMAELRKIEEEE